MLTEMPGLVNRFDFGRATPRTFGGESGVGMVGVAGIKLDETMCLASDANAGLVIYFALAFTVAGEIVCRKNKFRKFLQGSLKRAVDINMGSGNAPKQKRRIEKELAMITNKLELVNHINSGGETPRIIGDESHVNVINRKQLSKERRCDMNTRFTCCPTGPIRAA